VALLLLASSVLAADSPDKSQYKDEEKGFTLYERFEGSSNTLGKVMKFDSTVGYNFNPFFGVDVGLPVYMVRPSTTSSSTPSLLSQKPANGIGDAYVDLKLTFDNPLLNFASTLTGRAPTGNTRKGFSTGRATFDWNNHFDRDFLGFQPFVEAGLANSISDNSFFTRPFLTLGKVAHFEGGLNYSILHFFSAGASLYDELPWGQQKVYSRLIQRQAAPVLPTRRRPGVFEILSQTVGSAALARDNGYSAWFDASPLRYLDFEVGFSHSVHYALNTVSFGMGLNLGFLFKSAKHI
jgi:hypothetical protein